MPYIWRYRLWHYEKSWQNFLVHNIDSLKIIYNKQQFCALSHRDTTTYSCPWVKMGSSSSTPNLISVWPCTFYCRQCSVNGMPASVGDSAVVAADEQHVAGVLAARDLCLDVPTTDLPHDVSHSIAVTSRPVHVPKQHDRSTAGQDIGRCCENSHLHDIWSNNMNCLACLVLQLNLHRILIVYLSGRTLIPCRSHWEFTVHSIPPPCSRA